jgi:hypothetical protein
MTIPLRNSVKVVKRFIPLPLNTFLLRRRVRMDCPLVAVCVVAPNKKDIAVNQRNMLSILLI